MAVNVLIASNVLVLCVPLNLNPWRWPFTVEKKCKWYESIYDFKFF